MKKCTLVFFSVLLAFGIWMLFMGKPVPKIRENFPLYTVSSMELAEMMVQGRKNFSVIDLTNQAENFYFRNGLKVDMSKDIISQILEFIERNRQQNLILVGESIDSVRDIANILMSKKYRVLALNGGVDSWRKDILTPHLPLAETNQEKIDLYKKTLSLSNYLQGKLDPRLSKVSPLPPPTVKIERKSKSSGGGGGC